MIKKECQLVPVPRSLKEYNAGVLVQLAKTKQYGTIRPDIRPGLLSRRNLRTSFNPITLYITGSNVGNTPPTEVIFTLKDGSKVAALPNDLMEEDIVAWDPIILTQREILNSLVYGANDLPPMHFHFLKGKFLQDLFNRGGKVYLEMEISGSPKLVGNHHIIHFQ